MRIIRLVICIALCGLPSTVLHAQESAIRQLVLTPTVRFVQDGSKLKQVLDLAAQFSPGTTGCSATLKVGDATADVALHPDPQGSASVELYVDEVKAPLTAEVTVTCGSETRMVSCEVEPRRHWKLYVQPSAHVDIGYTNYQERIAQSQNDSVALALDLCAKYPEFKWNTEAAWVEDNFLSMMPPDRQAEFIRRAKEGRIGCEAIYANMLTGLCSHESLIRDLYYAHSVAKKYGIPYDIAMSSDVPTQVWTLPTILANAGIKYFSTGVNITRGDSFTQLFDRSPLYWQGPDGSKVLTWFSLRYRWASRLSLTENVDKAKPAVDDYLKGFDRPNYPYDAVLGFGGYGDNRQLQEAFAATVHEWNAKYAYPKVILCRGPEFFKYIEANYKDKIPTISGDGGVYWEDGAASSAAETAMVRRAKENLASAEKIYSLASCLGGTAYPKADIDRGWKNAILYDEHTWGSSVSIRNPKHDQTIHQWKVKAGFAHDAAKQADSLVSRALDGLARSAGVKAPSILVFNPLSRPVSDWVTVKGNDGPATTAYVRGVRPLGYKVVPYVKRKPLDRALPTGRTPVLENRYYRLEFDRATGAVRSVYDKQLKRELIDLRASYGLNQYIYTVARADTRLITDIRDVTRDEGAPPVVFEKRICDAGQVMRVTGTAHNTPQWTATVVLQDKAKRIDFANILNKDETYEKEAGYFAFPFALTKPEWYVELPDGVVRPKKQMLPGACMQWYCAQDYVAAADDKCAVVWTAVESPLLTIGDINRETFKSPLPIENGHLYAYVFNNYWFTNYKASQGGELRFSFSLTSMPKYDPVEAATFGESVRNPMAAKAYFPTRTGHHPPASGSLCSAKPSNVIIQAVKQAESGKGLVIRLREVAGKKSRATVTLPTGKLREVWSCNLLEDPRSKLPISCGKVSITVPAHGLATILAR